MRPAVQHERARELIATSSSERGRLTVVYHADADGISAAALVCETVEQLGGVAVGSTPPKGRNVYDEDFRARLTWERPRGIVVVDTGSRAGVSWRHVPTVIVDHHVATEPPDAAAFVHDETALSTSLLVLDLLAPFAPPKSRSWLAAVGAIGDAGDGARRDARVAAAMARYGAKYLREVAVLVNASGRAAVPAPEVALQALLEADDPRDVAIGDGLLARRLRDMRGEVSSATRRAMRAAPRIRGRWAIIEIAEGSRVHGVVASAWARRLAPRIVLVANTGYVAERVHLSIRSHEALDLREALRRLLPNEGEDYAAGHARATGAIIDIPTYARLLAAIADESAVVGAEARQGGAASRSASFAAERRE